MNWLLTNIPSFMGRVRARATCLKDGETISGESSFFTVGQNERTDISDIVFDDPDPIPVELAFSAGVIPQYLTGILSRKFLQS